MFENDGSTALKQYEYAQELPLEVEEPRRTKKTKPRQRQLNSHQKKAIISATIAVFVMALTVLMFKAELNTRYRELSQSKDKLSALSSQVEQLSSELEGSGIVAVEEKAAEMGLQQARESQMVYIDLNTSDSGEILEEDSGTSGLSQFLNKVAAIAEYLY